MKKKSRVSVVIMTLNAANEVGALIEALFEQTRKPDEVVVADSMSVDGTGGVIKKLMKKHPEIKFHNIARRDFDHGTSRDEVFRKTTGDYVFFFTQDAVLEQKEYIEIMLSAFEEPGVAMAYARHKAKPDARLYEKYIREFKYPMKRSVRSQKDLKTLGVKTFFMSDTCSVYDRAAYLELGGFEHNVRTNEDMLMACKAIQAGYKVVYEARAYVLHSHNLSLRQEYERNKLVAWSMAKHEDEFFSGVSVEGEGFRLVKNVSGRLLKRGRFISWVHFGFICVAKYLGYQAGEREWKKSTKVKGKTS